MEKVSSERIPVLPATNGSRRDSAAGRRRESTAKPMVRSVCRPPRRRQARLHPPLDRLQIVRVRNSSYFGLK
jgi:hypothetical protein